LAIEHLRLFWAGYRNAINIWAFAIAAIAALTISNCALTQSFKNTI
jgi:hypothetical protein